MKSLDNKNILRPEKYKVKYKNLIKSGWIKHQSQIINKKTLKRKGGK